ncbi:MAG: 4-demethylwyosine synthase TYW1, partial [Thermoproteota archaeon]
IMERQGYKMVLNHSAVKLCHWLREAILRGRTCYKHRFFGTPSWRCVQMTPTAAFCNHQCLHCWRINAGDLPPSQRWDETPGEDAVWDDPEDIAVESIRVQRELVQGFKGVPRANRRRIEEAKDPIHAAISLTGEPTLYPMIGGLIYAYKRRGMSTFLVTNGTLPERLESLECEPTQLYVTVNAYEKSLHMRIARPLWPDSWERLLRTLSLIESFSCPVVMRITLIKGVNMRPEGFAELVRRYNPTYVEPKAYMHVGFSRRRLTRGHMPSHREVREFAERLAELTGYRVLDEHPDSRVVLLSRLERPIRFF